MQQTRTTLDSYFITGNKPTAQNFQDLIDSFSLTTETNIVAVTASIAYQQINNNQTFDGSYNLISLSASQIYGTGTPTISTGAGIGGGLSATSSIVGSNLGGVISITSGTAPSTNAMIVHILLTNTYNRLSVVISPANQNAALLTGPTQVFTTTDAAYRFFEIHSSNAALQTNTAYVWNYQIIA